jgi:hypothetical protein
MKTVGAVMGHAFDKKQLLHIFSDALIIDVDLSSWDKYVDLWVLADHYRKWTDRMPLVIVRFSHVTSMNFAFQHYGIELECPRQHFKWRIDDFDISQNGNLVSIMLYSSSAHPRLQITCTAINVYDRDHSILDRLFPGWGSPYSAFVRPGIDGLFRRFIASS